MKVNQNIKKTVVVIEFSFSVLFIFFSLVACKMGDLQWSDGNARFRVEPSTEVEVGEEVLFDATDGQYVILPEYNTNSYEWDFGDGYYLQQGKPLAINGESGISCTHFFMKPGTYNVRLTVKTAGDSISVATKTMTVKGRPYNGLFELLHANFHGRISQYISARLTVKASAGGFIKITLSGDTGYKNDIFSSVLTSGQTVKFLLNNYSLPSGNYVLDAKLYSFDNILIDELKEKFSKPYNFIPEVGIDKNNAICVKGDPIFIVGTYKLSYNSFPAWVGKYINTAYAYYYTSFNSSSWYDYSFRARGYNIGAIGPGDVWEGFDSRQGGNVRNTDLTRLKDYVLKAKDSPGLFMWLWDDEPNDGGRDTYLPSPICRSWTYVSHKYDSQHLVAATYYGYNYMPFKDTIQYIPDDAYNYLVNDKFFGGQKVFPCDVITMVNYPIELFKHASYNLINIQTIFKLYIDSFSKVRERTYDLIPFMYFVEAVDPNFQPNPSFGGPTPEQLRMLAWINVVHGSKGIIWLAIDALTDEKKAVMEEFVQCMKELDNIILGAESVIQITDSANITTNRVDTLVREGNGYIWIFAVRVTEVPQSKLTELLALPFPAPYLIPTIKPPFEPATLTGVQFTLSTGTSGTVEVTDLLAGTTRTLSVSGGTFQDNFEQHDVHIYKIKK